MGGLGSGEFVFFPLWGSIRVRVFMVKVKARQAGHQNYARKGTPTLVKLLNLSQMGGENTSKKKPSCGMRREGRHDRRAALAERGELAAKAHVARPLDLR